jgi:hypothetical protein
MFFPINLGDRLRATPRIPKFVFLIYPEDLVLKAL